MNMRGPITAAAFLLLAACGQPDAEKSGESGEAVASTGNDAPATAQGAAAPVAATPGVAAPARPGVAIEPADETIGWIAVDWLGLDISAQEWAAEEVGRRSRLNEFSRDEAIVRQTAQVEEARRAGANIGVIRIPVDTQLSDYDADYGEIYVQSFSPGSRLTFRPFHRMDRNPFPEGVEIRFRNGGDASVWSIESERAQRIINQLGYGRHVRAEATLHIVQVNTTGRGAAILTDIASYTLYSRKGERLGEVRLNGAPSGQDAS